MLKLNSADIDKYNTIYFDSDEDFYNFAVVPKLEIVSRLDDNGVNYNYTDFNLSTKYYNAINDGMSFVIKDEDSQIFKHGCVSYRTISKPIQNLKQYFKEY